MGIEKYTHLARKSSFGVSGLGWYFLRRLASFRPTEDFIEPVDKLITRCSSFQN